MELVPWLCMRRPQDAIFTSKQYSFLLQKHSLPLLLEMERIKLSDKLTGWRERRCDPSSIRPSLHERERGRVWLQDACGMIDHTERDETGEKRSKCNHCNVRLVTSFHYWRLLGRLLVIGFIAHTFCFSLISLSLYWIKVVRYCMLVQLAYIFGILWRISVANVCGMLRF